VEQSGAPSPSAPAPSQGSVFGKILGKGKSSHRDGLRLSYREGKYEEAIPYFDKAIEIDPSHAAAWHDRGVCLRELGRDAEALKNFVKAVELAPDNEEFLYSSADMLKRIGILQAQQTYIDAAFQAFSRVVEVNPNHDEAWNSMGVCMKELGRDSAANEYFERANGILRQNKSRKNVRNLDSLV
jgi:Flp pilus assembly protein TadD